MEEENHLNSINKKRLWIQKDKMRPAYRWGNYKDEIKRLSLKDFKSLIVLNLKNKYIYYFI